MLGTLRIYRELFGWVGLIEVIAARISGKSIEQKVQGPQEGAGLLLRVPSSDVLAFREVFTRREYAASFREAPEFIIDAGANVGLTTSFLAGMFPEALIVAIEPEPDNFKQLVKNTKGYGNIQCLQAALWASSRSLSIVEGDGGAWGFRTIPGEAPIDEATKTLGTVQGVTIPEIMKMFGRERIGFLKLDIEGAERELFGDARAWIERIDVIAVELHERFCAGTLRAFYNGSNGFSNEWIRGDTVWLARDGFIEGAPHALES
jgi:FkbM family methyltransferase